MSLIDIRNTDNQQEVQSCIIPMHNPPAEAPFFNLFIVCLFVCSHFTTTENWGSAQCEPVGYRLLFHCLASSLMVSVAFGMVVDVPVLRCGVEGSCCMVVFLCSS